MHSARDRARCERDDVHVHTFSVLCICYHRAPPHAHKLFTLVQRLVSKVDPGNADPQWAFEVPAVTVTSEPWEMVFKV